MIYLAGKIFFYLLLALGLGGAAGWLWRNLQAVNREVLLERQLVESRSRMPQLETAVRSREQQLEAVRADLKAREQALDEQQALLAERDRLTQELNQARTALQRRPEPAAAAADSAAGDLDLHLGHPSDLPSGSPQEPAPAAASESMEAAAERDALELELDQTRQQLAAARTELERTARALSSEQRRVEELTRERELQSLSLKALEQQLEMARETPDRAVANG